MRIKSELAVRASVMTHMALLPFLWGFLSRHLRTICALSSTIPTQLPLRAPSGGDFRFWKVDMRAGSSGLLSTLHRLGSLLRLVADVYGKKMIQRRLCHS